jgi:hypothetical protein
VLVVALTLGTTTADVTAAADVVTARAATPKVATPKVGACDLLSTDDLGLALGSAFQAGSPFDVGAGTSCGFDAIGPVRGATTRVVRGKAAKTAMATTLKALRDTLRSVDSAPPSKVAGLGDKAFYSLDEFLGEGSIEVLDGKTFVQVTAIVAPNGDQGLVSEAVLSGLAEQALAAAK